MGKRLTRLIAAARSEITYGRSGQSISSPVGEVLGTFNMLGSSGPQSVAEAQAMAAIWLAASARYLPNMAPVWLGQATSLVEQATKGKQGSAAQIQHVGASAIALLEAGGSSLDPKIKGAQDQIRAAFDVGQIDRTSRAIQAASPLNWALQQVTGTAKRPGEVVTETAQGAGEYVDRRVSGAGEAIQGALPKFECKKKRKRSKIEKTYCAAQKAQRRINWWLKWGPVIGIGTIAGLGVLAIVVRAPKT